MKPVHQDKLFAVAALKALKWVSMLFVKVTSVQMTT